MNVDNQRNKSNSFVSSISNQIKEFQIIKEYLNSEPEKINQINEIFKSFNNIINNFIEYTKNYSSQIEFLALKIIPNYSIEGQLIQSFQTLLLFYSEGLNTLILELRNIISSKNDDKINDMYEKLKSLKKNYSLKLKEVNISYKSFKREINLYQEYLLKKEIIEHEKKGFSNNKFYDDVIFIKENENNSKDEIQIIEKQSNLAREQEDYSILNEKDNKSDLIKSNNEYINYINESNDLLKNIIEFLSEEKTKLLKNIHNLSIYFGNILLKFSQNINNNFETQIKVLNKLKNKLTLKEKNVTILTDFSIKLKYLEIYKNIISEKKSINDKDKIKSNETKNDKNTEIKNNISFNNFTERKTLNLSNKKNDYNDKERITFNPNQLNNLIEEEKEEIIKYIVENLNRNEIIHIFGIIKETNILLNNSDIELIEYENNYKKKKELLIILFIYPEKYKEEHKKTMINLFEKDKKYIFYFFKVLSNNRENSFISEFTFKYLVEIFKWLNDYILNNNYMELFKYILILSQTYYYKPEKSKEKLFLFSYIKGYKGYTNIQFWNAYLNELIKHDLKNLNLINIDLNNINIENKSKDEKEHLLNSFFSNLMTTIKVMSDFNLDKKFLKEFIINNKNKYYLSDNQINNICSLYEIELIEERNKNDNKNTDLKEKDISDKKNG